MKIAQLKYDQRAGKWKAFYAGTMLCQSENRDRVINQIETGLCNKARLAGVTGVAEGAASVSMSEFGVAQTFANFSTPSTETQIETPKFTVDERFQFISDFTKMVIVKEVPSLIVTGDPGLGKTTTVLNVFDDAGLINSLDMGDISNDEDGQVNLECGDYITIKGFTTAKALYRVLHAMRGEDKTVILDDCDEALGNKDAVSILKGALDSGKKRFVSWNSEMKLGDSLPRAFQFEGSCIFISNRALHQVDAAIRSRSLCVDLQLSIEEKFYWMRKNLENFLPDRNFDWKEQCLSFLESNSDLLSEISFRTLTQVCKTRSGMERAGLQGSWERKALFVLTRN